LCAVYGCVIKMGFRKGLWAVLPDKLKEFGVAT
jgi:hypothetical protein